MSSFTSGSFVPSPSDSGAGVRGFIARLDSASNAAGLSTPVSPGVSYDGVTVENRSANNRIRVEFTFVAGTLVAPGDTFMIVGPNGTQDKSFDSSVIESVRVQAVQNTPPGSIVDVGTLPPALTGASADVFINFIQA